MVVDTKYNYVSARFPPDAELFAETFLKGRIRYDTQVLNICRRNDRQRPDAAEQKASWVITAKNVPTGNVEELCFDIVILSTGVRILEQDYREII